jgi:hypothetical protein
MIMTTCGSCGSSVPDNAAVCPQCGKAVEVTVSATPSESTAAAAPSTTATAAAPDDAQHSFCAYCGSVVLSTDVKCPACGRPVGAGAAASRGAAGSVGPSGYTFAKKKTVAVLLAVFLSGWSWLYTYEVNRKKFWIFFAVGVITAIFYIVGISGAHTVQNCDDFGYCTQKLEGLKSGFLALGGLGGFGLWLWAIIDNSTKPSVWYDKYPNG